MKEVIIRKINNKYKIPLLINIKNNKYYFEYKDKIYDKELNVEDKEVKQISYLVSALNIKNKKERLSYAYDKACDLLDDDFYGKNVCKFKNNKCIKDREEKREKIGGCCVNNDNKRKCWYLSDTGCKVRCMACKFHICYCLKKRGYKYKINDIYVLKYLFNWKQKIMLYNDFFMSKEEVLEDIYKNNLLKWAMKKNKKF